MSRPTEIRLRRVFGHVLRSVLGGAVLASGGAACSGYADGPGGGGGGPVPDFTSICEEAKTPFLEGLRATPPVDGVVNRYENAFRNDSDQSGLDIVRDPYQLDDQWQGSSGQGSGSLCAAATDKAACLTKTGGYRLLSPTHGACQSNGYGCYTTYFLYTRGDEIGVAETPAEVRALIGAVDTVQEAIYVAQQGKSLSVSCGASGIENSRYRTTQDGGYDLILTDASNCGKTTYEVDVHVDPAGNVTEVERSDLGVKPGCAVAGRRPAGFVGPRPEGDRDREPPRDHVGAYFASMATLEAASVTAFRRLHRQLKAHGAPPELLQRIRTAARDEIRHARAVTDLARRFGVNPDAPEIGPFDPRASLLAIARENAREGCVRETFGALLAQVQKTAASSPEVRGAMAAIADEETAHAALSWDIAAWIDAQLTDEERAEIAEERRHALLELAREVAAADDADVRAIAGLPAPAAALALLRELGPALLAA